MDEDEPITMREAHARAVRVVASMVARRQRVKLTSDQVEDIAQETVARYLENADTVLDPDAWATRVAQRLCIDAVRHRQRELVDEDALELRGSSLAVFLKGGRLTSRDAMLAVQVQWAMDLLTVKERQIIELQAQGVSQTEIAEILGYANANSVKATLNRIRRRLEEEARRQGQPLDWESHPRPY
jgi:RNA polymerase sigma factor (sigma-70 family)